MSPQTFRILGIVLCLMAAFMAAFNFSRPTSLTLKLIPLILFLLGVRQIIRAKAMVARQ